MAAPPATLEATGKAVSVEVKAPGARVRLEVRLVAGARYRVSVLPDTLGRALLEWGRPGEPALVSVTSPAPGAPAVHEVEAEARGRWEVGVGGFSASVGRARVRLETLDPQGRRAPAHWRYLVPDRPVAQVGELLLREADGWILCVEPGQAYEIEPTEGSAGRVRLRVRGPDGAVRADSEASALSWMARPGVRFAVPEGPLPAVEPAPYVLEVRGLFDGGGTYGLRLRPLAPGQSVEPPALEPPPEVPRGPIADDPDAFGAGPGDLAFLYVAHTPLTRIVQVRRGERWVTLEGIGPHASARSQENALLVWFRPYYPGVYRFVTPMGTPSGGERMLLDRAGLGGAPIHLGTGVDPQVRVRLGKRFELVGLAGCMPGFDYLFVLVEGPEQGVGMRVLGADGRKLAERTVSAAGAPIAPGYGPSLRFRVKAPGVYRLEARGARPFVVAPLLRRALD